MTPTNSERESMKQFDNQIHQAAWFRWNSIQQHNEMIALGCENFIPKRDELIRELAGYMAYDGVRAQIPDELRNDPEFQNLAREQGWAY